MIIRNFFFYLKWLNYSSIYNTHKSLQDKLPESIYVNWFNKWYKDVNTANTGKFIIIYAVQNKMINHLKVFGLKTKYSNVQYGAIICRAFCFKCSSSYFWKIKMLITVFIQTWKELFQKIKSFLKFYKQFNS